MHAGSIRVGISGYDYPAWSGSFYPTDLPRRQWLHHASRAFATIELNSTFYRLQRPRTFLRFKEEVPAAFRFAVKGSRYVTHMKKLHDVEGALALFFQSGVLLLEEKLGPILWQLPPQLSFHAERVETFLALLPKDTCEVVRLVQRCSLDTVGMHDIRMNRCSRICHAIEVRHPSFYCREFFELLERYRVCLVAADLAGSLPVVCLPSSDVGYARLHGATQMYRGRYSDERMNWWVQHLEYWSRPARDIYVYFDNTDEADAPADAIRFQQMLAEHVTSLRPPAP